MENDPKAPLTEQPQPEVQPAKAGEGKDVKAKRPPQLVTENGDEISGAHVFKSDKSDDWYFIAKLNGKQLKGWKITSEELAAFIKKEIGVPELMQKYYPSVMRKRVPVEAYRTPHDYTLSDGRKINIEVLRVYKNKNAKTEKDPKYKFFAVIDGKNYTVAASPEMLGGFFNRTSTPGQIIEHDFTYALAPATYYSQFKLPEGLKAGDLKVCIEGPEKDETGKVISADKNWYISATLPNGQRTDKKIFSPGDGVSLWRDKTATREQLAVKYFEKELPELMKQAPVQQKSHNNGIKH